MPGPYRPLIPVAALFLLLLSAGCSEKLSRKTGLTDAGLYALGQQKTEKKQYGEAAEAYQMLIERFPTSPLASQAQFSLASSRMANGEELEAEVAFDDFLRLHPADPKVPDALFQKGDLLNRQVLNPGRAQGKTQEAIESYKRFLEKEQGTPRSAVAAARITDLRNRMALHESTVISHYISRKLYENGETRARRVIAEYPDVPATAELMSLLALTLEKQGKKEDAAQVRQSLAVKYPEAVKEKPSAVAGLLGRADPGSAYRSRQGRQGRYEFSFQPRYVASKDIGFEGGSKVELDQALGVGVGFGYNITDKFALQLDASWSKTDYQAKIATSAGGNPGTATVDGTLHLGTIALDMSYYFLDGPLTPFVMGGFGWTVADSNIPSGPPQDTCWWDPWYGYICTAYQNTYKNSYFSYNLGLGARWEVTQAFFLRGSVGWQWVDLGRAGTTDFMGGRLDLGYMY